jgi:hypothetical protein
MDIIVDNTGFNGVFWARYSEAEFIQLNMTSGTYRQYNDGDRIALLKFAYKQITGDFTRDAKEA